jgi:hypothetical protein
VTRVIEWCVAGGPYRFDKTQDARGSRRRSPLDHGGRLFSTAMSVLTLETYYRFSPLLGDDAPPVVEEPPDPKKDGGK